MKIFRTRVENRKAPHGKTGPYREGDEWFAVCGDGKVLRLLEVEPKE
jgi:hypothetical protein